jgi:quercetin dioxygenase-like cupin family protein
VKIAPNKSILNHVHEKQLETHEVIGGSGTCINAGQNILYEPGTISIMSAGIEHEVIANDDGLYLFAKFIPALA